MRITLTLIQEEYAVSFSGCETKYVVTYNPLGDQGVPGKSAYEIAVQYGYTGTEQEWVEMQKKTWLDYVVGALSSETISSSDEIEIDKLTFPNNRIFYRKSTDTTDGIYQDEACTILVVDRVQKL